MSVKSESYDKLEEIYTWIEQITFSKPKKNLARDFSDGGKDGKSLCYTTFKFLTFLKSLSNKFQFLWQNF